MFGKISVPGKAQAIEKKQVKQLSTRNDMPDKTKQIYKHEKLQKRTNKIQAQSKIANTLKGSKFRVLNQLLYTRPSSQALQYFQQHEEDFETYHQGFRQQAQKWSQNPLQSIIGYLKKHHADKKKLILDLGCGEGQLHETLSKVSKVRSFDLVAKKSFVEIADIANLPVEDASADACVFCLSLMGVNYLDFIMQARRVLKESGELLIAEVQSRCKQWPSFIRMVESLGFELKTNKSNNYFRLIYFKSNLVNKKKLKIPGQSKDIKTYSQQLLGSCLYKKR